MSKSLYVAYFAVNPYGEDVPTQALDAARKALEDQLGVAWQVLGAKAAFEKRAGCRRTGPATTCQASSAGPRQPGRH